MKFALGFFVMLFGSAVVAAPINCNSFSKTTSSGNASQRLKRYMQTEWTYFMQEAPEWATSLGYPEGADRWTDKSIGALERREKESVCIYMSIFSFYMHAKLSVFFYIPYIFPKTSLNRNKKKIARLLENNCFKVD